MGYETADQRAARLSDETGCPSHNLQGDPLTRCTNCAVVIYAVAALGEYRHMCADCRGVMQPGNVDPWAGPVDPVAHRKAGERHHAECRRAARAAARESCGCWCWDCDECGRKLGDGQRPAPGQRATFWRQTVR